MAFNSIEFLFFFPIVIILYFILDYRYRWILLLVASYTFYMFWNAWYIALILLSTGIDYYCGLKLEADRPRAYRRRYLFLSLVVNLSLLFFFKYFNFFNESIRNLALLLNMEYAVPALMVLLPVGISFYTFQTLSYTIDVFERRLAPEKHFGYFALYVSFFPQLVAGPIERGVTFIPQLRKKFSFDYKRITDGLKLMAFGLFKKVVIADQLGVMVDFFYQDPDSYYGITAVIMPLFFFMQVYCDFSAYSDIAIGAAQVMGFSLMKNFANPILSRSVSEFWQRWHISLTTWFRDYIFRPLSRGERRKNYLLFYLFLIFFLSGFWHGANWTFLLWGTLNGLLVLGLKVTQKRRNKVKETRFYRCNEFWIKPLEIFFTFFIISILTVYFRSDSLEQSHQIFASMTDGFWPSIVNIVRNENQFRLDFLYFGQGLVSFALLMGNILILFWIENFQLKRGSIRSYLAQKPAMIRWTLSILLIFDIILFSVPLEQPFIYFQF